MNLLSIALGTLLTMTLHADTPETRLRQLNLTLPDAPAPVANYLPAVRSGSLLFLAGHLPRTADGTVIAGKVGRECTIAEARRAAEAATLALLATLRTELGNLDRVGRIVRVGGFVNATENFSEHPAVLNGCSDLLVAIFGERGRHARAAIGVASLPMGATVEIELLVEVRP